MLTAGLPNPVLSTFTAVPEACTALRGEGQKGLAATLNFMGTNSSLNYEGPVGIHEYKSTNETQYHLSGMNSPASFHQMSGWMFLN